MHEIVQRRETIRQRAWRQTSVSGGNICVAAASVRQLHVCGSSKRAAVFDINKHGQKQALCSSVWKQAAQHYTTCSVMRVGTSVVRASGWQQWPCGSSECAVATASVWQQQACKSQCVCGSNKRETVV